MLLVAVAWLYVVVLMAVVEASSSTGTVLGALFTLLLYGLMPLALVLYLLATPARRKARRAAEQAALAQTSAADPDGGGHPPGGAVAPVREEP